MGWPQNAYVGQKVVCIDDSLPLNPWHCKHPLIKNEVYQIYKIDDGMGICLCFQIDNSTRFWGANRFRPAQSTETGMSILNAILKDSKIVKEIEYEGTKITEIEKIVGLPVKEKA